MAASVSKLDVVFGELMPKDAHIRAALVPVESPQFDARTENDFKILN
jgi:hypothetical protein